jgi:hypothetical protein
MPSPFPGMDPFLEDPGLWPDVHHELISTIRGILNEVLKPKYYVRIEQRVYVSDETDPGWSVIIPDARILHQPLESAANVGTPNPASAIAEPVVATTLIEEEPAEARLEIVDRTLRQVVTVMEILSPANKIARAHGRRSYQRKRLEVMRSPSHFVEIDLLRDGERFPIRGRMGPCEYLVHISRVEMRPEGMLWPVRLPERLPIIPIPLRDMNEQVNLDLQQVLNTAYDRAAYDLEIDYTKDPIPPMPPEFAAWAQGVTSRNSRAT